MKNTIEVNRDVKQVIVMRADLKCRKGKMCAQSGHAAIQCLVGVAHTGNLTTIQNKWLTEGMTKICVRVDSEEELLDIFKQAKADGLEVHLITDAGLTEFKEPTRTCLAIGPDWADKIDKITGELKLL